MWTSEPEIHQHLGAAPGSTGTKRKWSRVEKRMTGGVFPALTHQTGWYMCSRTNDGKTPTPGEAQRGSKERDLQAHSGRNQSQRRKEASPPPAISQKSWTMRSAVCRVCKEEFWDGALHKLDRPQDEGKPETGAKEEEGSWLTPRPGCPCTHLRPGSLHTWVEVSRRRGRGLGGQGPGSSRDPKPGSPRQGPCFLEWGSHPPVRRRGHFSWLLGNSIW